MRKLRNCSVPWSGRHGLKPCSIWDGRSRGPGLKWPSGLRESNFMKEIPLTNGGVALVDDGDFHFVMKWKWRRTSKGYVRANDGGHLLHRIIMNAPDGKLVDHWDGNKLDNRRSNLRMCNNQQNIRNSKPRSGTSNFKGVSKDGVRWIAKIKVDGVSIALGGYSAERDAALAYDRAALKHFGEFARLNFPGQNDQPEWAPGEVRLCAVCLQQFNAKRMCHRTCGARTCSTRFSYLHRKRRA